MENSEENFVYIFKDRKVIEGMFLYDIVDRKYNEFLGLCVNVFSKIDYKFKYKF